MRPLPSFFFCHFSLAFVVVILVVIVLVVVVVVVHTVYMLIRFLLLPESTYLIS